MSKIRVNVQLGMIALYGNAFVSEWTCDALAICAMWVWLSSLCGVKKTIK